MGSSTGKLRPEAMSDLQENTKFTEVEIRQWYKDFLKDFPSGTLTIDQFKDVYIQHFPNGDATKFAEHVFRTFDQDNNHRLDFREFMIALSVTARGGPKDRLRWAFQMYDVDENGFITKDECTEIIKALYRLMGPTLSPECRDVPPEQRTNSIFSVMDVNADGKLSLEEFVDGAYADPVIVAMLTQAIYHLRSGDVGPDNEEVEPKQRVDQLFEAVDQNKDGVISLQEFTDGARMDDYLIRLLQHDQFRF